MIRQVRSCRDKLHAAGMVRPERLAILVEDDQLLQEGAEDLLALGRDVFAGTGAMAMMIAEPDVPLQTLIPMSIAADVHSLTPLDTETRTFLHDIPVIRRHRGPLPHREIIAALRRRKGVLVEDVGLIAVGQMTVEQTYVNLSSLYHALFVSCLLRLVRSGRFLGAAEKDLLRPLVRSLSVDIPPAFADMPSDFPDNCSAVRHAMAQAGRRTVELKLVDSFFGNVSCRSDQGVLISQTGASLDHLDECIDLVPDDNSSTAGITASSELVAHRAIYRQTKARVILHGHPKFSVIASLNCAETDCPVSDCWRECTRPRSIGPVPIVAGEIGAGGIAETLPAAMAGGIAIVYGHGVFACGQQGFRDPLQAMIALENRCRREYLNRLISIQGAF